MSPLPSLRTLLRLLPYRSKSRARRPVLNDARGYRPFVRLLLCLALLTLASVTPFRSAVAADTTIAWNPKFTPPVSRAKALQLARQGLGPRSRTPRCVLASLRSQNKEHSAGEWRLRFADAQGKNEKEVVVAFRKGSPNPSVRVYNGVLER